ncbi:DUF4340 domain-containing protein [Roseibacillus persicicus]|uniref:DUF4340 domain-containing protein n=1 Tax=Roseibacillus persicicus TaxID=454148 RepID=UPI0028104AEB|nr:DUF4340 domain-containing protein [Roseibacillus persicicus]MDQ8190432.1 DUF4340 domain-containing protein [Roseibacillus persicicus]
MRSKIFTTALALLALASGAMAFLHLTQKDLSSLFGDPPAEKGSRLFEFQPNEIRGIIIEAGGKPQGYEERQGQWLLKGGASPDRADYRVLEALLAFSADLTILDSFPANEDNKKAMGLSPARAHIQLKDDSGKSIADFSFGKKGAWQRHIPAPDQYTAPQNWPSVYLLPRGSESIYLCSSPYLDDILVNGFGPHRDLRPFFFPPELLAEVTIARPNGNLVLARSNPAAAWKIVKPFKLDADSEAVAELVGGLYKLTAKTASNKPAPPSGEPSLQLGLRFFSLDGSVHEVPVTLSLTEPNKEEYSYYLGRLDDWRKSIEFQIPRSTTEQLIGVDELPLTIERLRGASLSGLDLRQLRKLKIETPELTGPLEIEIGKSPITGEWRAQRRYAGKVSPANELTFFTVKKALTEEKALASVSDSVDDLSLYGLDTPILSLSMELFDGTAETIFFGEKIAADGVPHYYFRRNESHTVMEVESSSFYKIASRPYLWRDATIWNFNLVDLKILQIEREGLQPLVLNYSDLTQTWSARLGNEEATALLNENRANRYLETLEGLKVTRWLGPDHEPAARALQNPVFTLTAFFQRPDESNAPVERKRLRLAGAGQSGSSPFYYGQVEGDSQFFILDLASVTKLAEPLLESE